MQKIQVHLVDDIDGGAAEETVVFAIDGTPYAIDLNTANAQKLRELIDPYKEAARRVRAPKRAAGAKAGNKLSPEENTRIREWATAAGKPINERGRIPHAIVDEYRRTTG